NAVGKTSGNLSGAGTVGKIAVRFRIAYNNIRQLALLVGHGYSHDAGSDAAEFDISAGLVLDAVFNDVFSLGLAPNDFGNLHIIGVLELSNIAI
ncbi:MAG: hypothetical protein J5764_05870, partial [Bacteroidales bacterium]|nr:hypothetical protein [Bacteroidales bacterium]